MGTLFGANFYMVCANFFMVYLMLIVGLLAAAGFSIAALIVYVIIKDFKKGKL